MKLKICDLKNAPYNPRTISPESMKGLSVSLDKFGDISGIVWNKRSGNIISGHQRIKALKDKYGDSLKIKNNQIETPEGEKYPIRIVDWDKDMEYAANVAANSGKITGEFTDKLGEILKELEEDFIDFEDLRFDDLLDDLESLKKEEVKLEQKELTKPAELTWVLIGIPTVSFGSINNELERISEIPEVIMETTISDYKDI